MEWEDLYQEWRCETCYLPAMRDESDRGDFLPLNSQPLHTGLGKEDLSDGGNVCFSAAAFDGCVGGNCSTGSYVGGVMEAGCSAAIAEDATDTSIGGDLPLSNS